MQTGKNKQSVFPRGTSSLVGYSIGLISLGCPKNLVDSEVMLGLLSQAGAEFTTRAQEADILIVNTCGFIDSAKEEAIQNILEMAQYKDQGKCQALIVTGCFVQRFSAELAQELPEVDAFVGVNDFPEISQVVVKVLQKQRVFAVKDQPIPYASHWPRISTTPKHYRYLKIAEGCNNRCSYCTIPAIRGKYRSRSAEDIRNEAQNFVQDGVKEIILVAQDTTRYGQDLTSSPDFAELLETLANLPGHFWIRWLYAYPQGINRELIRVLQNYAKICTYVDLPLQHINARILRDMHRSLKPEQIKVILRDLRQQLPGVVLRTTFIVGFPGETEAEFQELMDFATEFSFDRMGVFTYSAEEGTPAAHLPNPVSEEVKNQRYQRLMERQQQISLRKNQDLIGQSLEVIVEELQPQTISFTNHTREIIGSGRSKREAPGIDGMIYLQGAPENLSVGEFVKVNITQANHYDLIGEIQGESTK